MIKPDDIPSGQQVAFWYYGATGAGKTHAALMEYPGAYRKIANNKWWDGYQMEDAVIMDDLDKKHDYMGYHLKIWGDRYAFVAETKGSSRYIRPKTIIVTSNYHPRDIWTDDTTLNPILRRFKVVRFMTLMDSIAPNHADDEVRQHWSLVRPETPPPAEQPPVNDQPMDLDVEPADDEDLWNDYIMNLMD